jgi:hypothetical protein
MPHHLVMSSYEQRIEAALAASRAAAPITHPGVKGSAREIFLRELLAPLLPPTFASGTGHIIDSTGRTSGEIDVVVYDRSVMPPLLFSQTASLGLFPVEACVYAIEVKSVATLKHWRDATMRARSVARLAYQPDVFGNARQNQVVPAMFCFASNLRQGPAAAAELERWQQISSPSLIRGLGGASCRLRGRPGLRRALVSGALVMVPSNGKSP